jgi:hypothetical protein
MEAAMITTERLTRRWRPLCLLFAATFCGCSIIGLTLGSISDASQPKEMNVPSWQVDTLKNGARVEVQLRDGSSVRGTYTGIELLLSINMPNYMLTRERACLKALTSPTGQTPSP